jgi:large subunit ribosomal protein L10
LPITREQKEAFVADYTDKLSRSQAAYITDYRGLTVAGISGLRTLIRDQSDAELEVAKNTLLAIAFQNAGLAVPEQLLEGPTAILFCFSDPVGPAKVLRRYADTNDFFSIKGGVVGQSILDPKGVQGMAELPPREQILASLVGAIQGPAQALFSTLNAPLREIAQVLNARGESAGES